MEEIFTFKRKDVFAQSLSPDKMLKAVVANNGKATALLLFEKDKIDFANPYVSLLIHDSSVCPFKQFGIKIKWSKDSSRVGIQNENKYFYGVIDLKSKRKYGANVILDYILPIDSDFFTNGITEDVGDDLNAGMKPKLNIDIKRNIMLKGFISPDEKWTRDRTKMAFLINDTCYAIIDAVNVPKNAAKAINPDMKPIKMNKEDFIYPAENDKFKGVSGELWAVVDFKSKRKLSFDTKNGRVRPINPKIWENGIPKNIGTPINKID